MATGKHRGLLLGLGIWGMWPEGRGRAEEAGPGLQQLWCGGCYAAWGHTPPPFRGPGGQARCFHSGSGIRGERPLGVSPTTHPYLTCFWPRSPEGILNLPNWAEHSSESIPVAPDLRE